MPRCSDGSTRSPRRSCRASGFLAANPLLLAGLTRDDGEPRVGAALTQLADELSALLPDRTPETVIMLRMALLSINAAVQAANASGASDAAVIAAAGRAARLVIRDLSLTAPNDR